MSETKDEKATKKAAKETKSGDNKVIAGPATLDKSVIDQAKEARNEADPKEDDGGAADTSAAKANYTDEQKSKDAAVKAKQDHLESLGLSPNAAHDAGGTRHFKVESAHGDPLYKGIVTVTGTSGEYDNAKISTRIDIGQDPRGEGWVKYAFKQHFPSADLDKGITIDPENKDDPLLRTKYD